MIPKPRIVLDTTAEVFGISHAEIRSSERGSANASYARFAAWMVLREFNKMTFTDIADLADRHHTTVMHGIGKGTALLQSNAAFRTKCLELTKRLDLKP